MQYTVQSFENNGGLEKLFLSQTRVNILWSFVLIHCSVTSWHAPRHEAPGRNVIASSYELFYSPFFTRKPSFGNSSIVLMRRHTFSMRWGLGIVLVSLPTHLRSFHSLCHQRFSIGGCINCYLGKASFHQEKIKLLALAKGFGF